MSDVARLVTADDPPAEVIVRARQAVIAALADHYANRRVTHICDFLDEVAAVAVDAITESGYALVRLPEPTEPEHQRPWRLMPEALWRVGRCEVTASFDGIDPKVGVGWDFGGGLGFKGDQVRRVAAAMLAAADHAERLADEHNTAAQDAEEGRADGQ